jgi:eukaryotic-like serine/threonine-protein kinase
MFEKMLAGDVTYERIRELGESPRGERLILARAHHEGLVGAQVVLKAVGEQADTRIRGRLEQQVRLASRLSHSAIGRVYGLHAHEGTLYAVMEYVEGDSVDSLFSDALLCGRYCSESLVLYVAAEVASALHHAHSLIHEHGAPPGILHRGLNAQRIRIGPRGEVKLMDFGLTRTGRPDRYTSSRSRLGGRGVYPSPEQILRQPLDGRSDLFALGLIMLELLTGQHLLWPMEDVDMRQLAKTLASLPTNSLTAVDTFVQEMHRRPLPATEELALLTHRARTLGFEDVEHVARNVPEPTRTILHTLLRREPAERYATAWELERALRERLRTLGHQGAAEITEEVFQLRAEAVGLPPEQLLTSLLGTEDRLLIADPDPLTTEP